jgi:hypothetical protein
MGIYDQLQTISTQSPTPKEISKPKERKPVEVKKETKSKQSTNLDKSNQVDKPKLADDNVMNASMHASNNARKQANNQPLINETIIETIRKAVKEVGKDSATYRFTSEEKRALLELSFSFKMQGYKTSENELTRIAINFLLEDQKQHGQNSVLQRVLDALKK